MRKALGAAALILVLGIFGAAQAATLKEVRLRPGPRATELLLALEGPVGSRVERAGGSLLVRLPGAQAAPGVSGGDLSDERVESVKVEKAGSGLVVRVRPRPGKPLGYVHLKTSSGVSLRLFADAPGREPAKTEPVVTKGPEAKKPEVKPTKPKAVVAKASPAKKPPPKKPSKTALAKKVGPQAATPAAEPKPPAKALEPKTPKHIESPPSLAAAAASGKPATTLPVKEELAELPEGGPDIGGLLPGTRPRRDDLARKLPVSRESQAAYDEASLRLKAQGYQEALSLFRKLEADFPGTLAAAKAAYRGADCLYGLAGAQEKSEEAVQGYLRAISKWPLGDEIGRAYLQIGRLYQIGGYEYEALGYLGLAIKHQPDSIYALLAYLSRGDLYFKRGKYREAAGEFTQVGRRFPNSAKVREANFKLVRSLFALRDFEGVELAYQEMKVRWPETFATDPQLLRYIGETYFQLGDYNRCREFLFYVLNIYPDSAANHLLLSKIGDSYLAQGRPLEAAKLYRLLIQTYPETDGARLAKMRLAENDVAEGNRLVDGLASGDNRLGELKLYEEVAASGGTTAQRAKVRIGLWHYWRRDYLKAAETLQQLLVRETLPQDLAQVCRYAIAESLFRQVHTYYQQGRYGDAVKLHGAWEKWFEGGQRAEVFYFLGECYRRSQLPREAGQLFLRAQSLPWREDRRQETLYSLGLARLETGEYVMAARNLREAAETFPDHPWRPAALRALGKAHYLSGRYQEAVMALEEALRYSGELAARAHDARLMGMALMEIKEPERAVAAFQDSLSTATTASDVPQQADASLELGNALYVLQRWDEAARAYRRVAQLAPGRPAAQQALYKAGKCYLALNRRQEAAQAFGAGAQGEGGVWKKASAQMLDGLNLGAMP